MLLGSSETVPVSGGQLTTGTWQSVLLVDFEGGRKRSVRIGVQGETSASSSPSSSTTSAPSSTAPSSSSAPAPRSASSSASSSSPAYHYTEITVETSKDSGISFHDITPRVRDAVAQAGVRGGTARVLSRHTVRKKN
jgi:cytoskeletal protein RodZ